MCVCTNVHMYDVCCAVVQGDTVHILDLAARLDSTAEYICKAQWGDISFPPPFGREALPEVSTSVFRTHSREPYIHCVWCIHCVYGVSLGKLFSLLCHCC